MLESLVGTLLNRVLSAYVFNLKLDGMPICSWSGKGEGEHGVLHDILRRVDAYTLFFIYLFLSAG